MDASEVPGLIDAAFNGVARPVTSLRQFRLTERKGMAGTISHEEWLEAGNQRSDGRRQAVSDAEIEECDVVLAHMRALEFQYYLPAYVDAFLRNIEWQVVASRWKKTRKARTILA